MFLSIGTTRRTPAASARSGRAASTPTLTTAEPTSRTARRPPRQRRPVARAPTSWVVAAGAGLGAAVVEERGMQLAVEAALTTVSTCLGTKVSQIGGAVKNIFFLLPWGILLLYER